MNLYIEHYPNLQFRLASFTSIFTVDINESFHEKLQEGQQLTNDIALNIFKQIKWRSDLFSFLANPKVLISLSVVIIIPGCFPGEGLIFHVAMAFVRFVGGALLGYSIQNYYNGVLPLISQAYSDQSRRAAEYINRIETSDEELAFVF